MLNTVERSLRFVSLLGIGDPIKLERFIAAHVDDASVVQALVRIAVEIGANEDDDGSVSETMDEVVEETSYIEALRERYLAVCRVGTRLQKVRRDFAHHTGVISEVDPVVRLISIPIHALGLNLAEVDARLSNIVPLFGDFELHRITIRDIRDEMFAHLNPWDQIMEDWARLSGDISDPYTVTPPCCATCTGIWHHASCPLTHGHFSSPKTAASMKAASTVRSRPGLNAIMSEAV
jgi:hypothetical protein